MAVDAAFSQFLPQVVERILFEMHYGLRIPNDGGRDSLQMILQYFFRSGGLDQSVFHLIPRVQGQELVYSLDASSSIPNDNASLYSGTDPRLQKGLKDSGASNSASDQRTSNSGVRRQQSQYLGSIASSGGDKHETTSQVSSGHGQSDARDGNKTENTDPVKDGIGLEALVAPKFKSHAGSPKNQKAPLGSKDIAANKEQDVMDEASLEDVVRHVSTDHFALLLGSTSPECLGLNLHAMRFQHIRKADEARRYASISIKSAQRYTSHSSCSLMDRTEGEWHTTVDVVDPSASFIESEVLLANTVVTEERKPQTFEKKQTALAAPVTAEAAPGSRAGSRRPSKDSTVKDDGEQKEADEQETEKEEDGEEKIAESRAGSKEELEEQEQGETEEVEKLEQEQNAEDQEGQEEAESKKPAVESTDKDDGETGEADDEEANKQEDGEEKNAESKEGELEEQEQGETEEAEKQEQLQIVTEEAPPEVNENAIMEALITERLLSDAPRKEVSSLMNALGVLLGRCEHIWKQLEPLTVDLMKVWQQMSNTRPIHKVYVQEMIAHSTIRRAILDEIIEIRAQQFPGACIALPHQSAQSILEGVVPETWLRHAWPTSKRNLFGFVNELSRRLQHLLSWEKVPTVIDLSTFFLSRAPAAGDPPGVRAGLSSRA